MAQHQPGSSCFFGAIASLLTTLALLCTATSLAADPLADSFRDPPRSARPMTWWHWMGGNVTREGITADLESMKQAGLQGAMIFHVGQLPIAGDVKFMSDEWWDLMRFAADEAARLGLQLGAHNCPGWSASGGPWITPEQSMQKLVWSTTSLEGGGLREAPLEQPKVDARWNHYRDVAVIALPEKENVTPDEVLDLTGGMSPDGKLTWDAPAGRWRVYRFGHTTTGKENHPAPPGGSGLEVDKFNPVAVEAHFRSYPEKLLTNNSPQGKKAFTILAIDSYEAGDQNWSPVFRDEFKRRRGYDPVKWLPILMGQIIGDDDTSTRFKRDMDQTVADLFHDSYYGAFGQLVREHPGVQYFVEPYGGAFNTITAGGKADAVMGEFWQGPTGWLHARPIASSAHVYGKTLVGAEAFTADPLQGQWRQDPYALKSVGDKAFAAGVNLMVLHTFAHQPYMNMAPGFTMGWWGTHFGRTQTWWNQSRPFFDYMARCQYLLQQGVSVSDILSLGSDQAPLGYKTDTCDEEVVLKRLRVQDGRLVLPNGASYALLVLPHEPMSLELAKRVRDLVHQGAFVVGPKPTTTGSLTGFPAADAQVKQIADEIWSDRPQEEMHQYGKGWWFADVMAALKQAKVAPDVTFPDATWPLEWTHRSTADAEIYFIANTRQSSVATHVSFRAGSAAPETWDPETGAIRPASVWSGQAGRTEVFLRLTPAGSAFVVFRKGSSPVDHVVELRSGERAITAPDRRDVGITIVEAQYGILDDPNRRMDVTQALRKRLSSGGPLAGTNEMAGRDPAPMVVKNIHVVYESRGQRLEKTFRENEPIEFETTATRLVSLPAAELVTQPDGATSLIAHAAGAYQIRFASGLFREINIEQVPPAIAISGPWQVNFPPALGAPPTIELHELASWTAHSNPGVRYFSGTAEYSTRFTAPSELLGAEVVTLLDMGDVRNLAEVQLNGQDLGILWKPPFRVDVTGKLRQGENDLKVRITNLWPNRMIGDEQEPEDIKWGSPAHWNDSVPVGRPLATIPAWIHDPTTRPSKGRVTLTTWGFFAKDTPLLESGLLGAVKLHAGIRRDLAR